MSEADFYIPSDLRPLPGCRVWIREVPDREEITVTFLRGEAVLHERTYVRCAWHMHAYNNELASAMERLKSALKTTTDTETTAESRRGEARGEPAAGAI